MPLQKQKSPASSIDSPTTPDTIIIPPPLHFIGKPQNLRDFIQTYSLPRVIKCDSKSCPNKTDLRSNIDIRQPLLAFTVRSVTKVSAHSLVFDKQQNDFITVGNGLLIPEDYPGWFAVLGDPNKISQKDLVIPVYSKLSLLAVSKCSQFLVGGRDPIQAVMFQTKPRSESKTMQIPVLPGTVLRCAGLYLGEYLTAKKKKKQAPKVEEFLKCYDENDRVLYLHMRQKGVFYVISKEGSAAASTQIMTMRDILTRFRLPLVVKLIYGRVPTTPCAFTQILLLTDQGNSDTLIASTLLCYRNINFEIPLGSKLQFQTAEQTPYLLDSRAYRRALDSCKDKTPSYIKDMKVVFGDPQLIKNGGTSQKPSQESDCNQVYTGPTVPTVPQLSSDTTTAKDRPNLPTVPQPSTVKDRPSLPSVPQPSSDTTMTKAVESPSADHVVPRHSARLMSRKSYLSDMSKRLTIHEDSLILADQPALPESPSPPPTPSPPDVDDDIQMSPVTTYTPPQPFTIGGQPTSPQPFTIGGQPTSPQSFTIGGQPTSPQPFTIVGQPTPPQTCIIRGQPTHFYRERENKTNGVYDNQEAFNKNKQPDQMFDSHQQLHPNTPDDCACRELPKLPGYPKKQKSPPVCPRTPVSPPLCPRTPVSIPVCPRTPESPPLCPRTPVSPPVCPRTPVSPPVCPRTPECSRTTETPVCPRTPESPPVCPRTTETPVRPRTPECPRAPREKEKIKSTISIPFKPGQPQSPNITQRKTPDYLPMHGRAEVPPAPHSPNTNTHRKLFRQPRPSPFINLHIDELPPPPPPHCPNSHKNLFPPSPPPPNMRMCGTPNGDNPHDYGSSSDEYSTPVDTQNDYAKIEHPADDTYIDPTHAAYPQHRATTGPSASTFGLGAQHGAPTRPPAQTSGLANKEMLIEELRKAGINSETELALRGLQSADIMSLLDRKDSCDDQLVRMLPTVGKCDLANIAACFRNLKLHP